MAASLSVASVTPYVNNSNNSQRKNFNPTALSPTTNLKANRIRCAEDNPAAAASTNATTSTSGGDPSIRDPKQDQNNIFQAAAADDAGGDKQRQSSSEGENLILKLAWYSSELLGIAASLFRSVTSSSSPAAATTTSSSSNSPADEQGTVDREVVVGTIKADFQRSYFVTGNLTLGVYEENCEFADPAGSFKGLPRFKRNCTNFGLLIEKSNMKLTKWEDFEDKGIGHWRFSCIMSFPWKPILSATGYTEYYFDAKSGRVCRHVEHWNVPKMALLKQLLRPSRGFWRGKGLGSGSGS